MEAMMDFLIRESEAWIRSQRNHHRQDAAALSSSDRKRLEAHFTEATLGSVRVARIPEIENPPFYGILEERGQPIPFDFRSMAAGITFIDTVVVAETKVHRGDMTALLFHECVHVIQYQLLGIRVFVKKYIHDWAEHGFDYFAIPFERDAYELQGRFVLAPDKPLFVEQEVLRRVHVLISEHG
jgi:hypothetical protein